MMWVLIAVAGAIGWLSLVALFVALCAMAGQADKLQAAHVQPPDAGAAGPYFRSRESRRALRSLPSV